MGANSRTIWEVAAGYKKHLDRSDRQQIDETRLLTLFEDTSFFNAIEQLRLKLSIPYLNPGRDIRKPQIILLDHRYGLNSDYLKKLTKQQKDKIEKTIYKQILYKWKLSFNFYPFIEWYLLYNIYLPIDFLPPPNPRLFELYKKYPDEFIRNPHTTSDKKFMLQMVKVKFGILGRPTIQQAKILFLTKALMSLNNNKERAKRDYKKLQEDLHLLSDEYTPVRWRGHKPFHYIAAEHLEENLDTETQIAFVSEAAVKKEADRLKKRLKQLKSYLKN